MDVAIIEGLKGFLKKSPTAFHAVHQIKTELEANGYCRLEEAKSWEIAPKGKYYVTRNGSSIIAFHVGSDLFGYGFQITASHSDSPAFKIKENATLQVKDKYIQLNTEGYGGMLCSTWFDRPLSVAGRVLVKEKGRLVTRLFDAKRDLVLIPSMAIHMNRNVNEGYAYNKQIDMLPLFGGAKAESGDFKKLIARELGVEEAAVYGSDLFLYNRMEPSVWGGKGRIYLGAPSG